MIILSTKWLNDWSLLSGSYGRQLSPIARVSGGGGGGGEVGGGNLCLKKKNSIHWS